MGARPRARRAASPRQAPRRLLPARHALWTSPSWLPPGSTAGRFKSACESPTTFSARYLHTAQHQRCLHVNGNQQPPSCRPAGGLVGFEPHCSVSDTQPRACVIRCPNKLLLPDTHQKSQVAADLAPPNYENVKCFQMVQKSNGIVLPCSFGDTFSSFFQLIRPGAGRFLKFGNPLRPPADISALW